MMEYILAILVAIILVTGSLFALIAGIGIIRLPDFYTRMHAAAKAGTVASGLLLLATGIQAQDPSILARALAGFIFFLLTAPVSSHLLARAAHKAGIRPDGATVVDEYRRDLEAKKPVDGK